MMTKMPILPILMEEYQRLKSMEKAYVEKLSSLPRGTIIMKKRSGKPYPYLVFREGSKVKTPYIKMKQLKDLQHKIVLRKKYEKALKEIRKDCEVLERVISK